MIINIPIYHIVPNAYQKRTDTEYGDIETLAQQIATARDTYPTTGGLMQIPIGRLWKGSKTLPASQWEKYTSTDPTSWPDDLIVELAYGHRRARAWQWLTTNDPRYADHGLPVDLRMLTDREMLAAVWRENEQRHDVSDFTRAALIEEMITLNNWTQQQAADHLGMGRSSVANLIRLLKFPDHLRQRIAAAGLSQRQVLALLPIYEHDTDTSRADNLIDDVIAHPASYPAETIRALADELKAPAPAPAPADDDPSEFFDPGDLPKSSLICYKCKSPVDESDVTYETKRPDSWTADIECLVCETITSYEIHRKYQTWTLNGVYSPENKNIMKAGDFGKPAPGQTKQIANRNGINAQPAPGISEAIEAEIAHANGTAPTISLHNPSGQPTGKTLILSTQPTAAALEKIINAMTDDYSISTVIAMCQYMSEHKDEPAPAREIYQAIVTLLECLRVNKPQEELT